MKNYQSIRMGWGKFEGDKEAASFSLTPSKRKSLLEANGKVIR